MRSVDDYVKLLIEDPYSKMLNTLDVYDGKLTSFKEKRPTDLSNYKNHINQLQKFQSVLSTVKFELLADVVLAVMIDEAAKEQDGWLQTQEEAYMALDKEIDELKRSIEESNRQHNLQALEANAQDNMMFSELEQKRKTLESYSDKIFDTCRAYGITSTDINLDETMFTPEELVDLYDEYLEFVTKEEEGANNVITLFKNKLPDVTTQGIVLLAILIASFTPILNILSIGFFGLLIANQIRNMKRTKYYSILMALVFNVKPENLGYVNFDRSKLLPETITPDMFESDPRFAEFEQRYLEIQERYSSGDPSQKQVDIKTEWGSKLPSITEQIKSYEKIYESKLFAIQADTNAEIAYLEKEYEKLKGEWKFIGERWSDTCVLNTTFSLGIHDDCIEEKVEVGLRNIIIRPSLDEGLMNKFIQAMYVNMISNVLPGKLKVDVYDPNGFGRALLPLYKSELSEWFETHNDGLDKLVDELVDYVQDNFKQMGSKDIQEFNKRAEDTGRTSIQYRLLIVLSQPKSIEEDEKLSSLFEYSATGGVIIWMVSPSHQSKSAHVFRRPFEQIEHPITNIITDEWCSKIAMNHLIAIQKTKPKGLLWADFMDNIWPAEKYWTGDCSKYIDFYPGYHEGDPTEYKPYTLGNEGNVHGIMVGTSGAGKSVALNHFVNSMCRIFHPKDFELWLCDFKGVEFQAYMNTPEHPYALPHIAACLCTSDGDYATSLFKAYRDKADKRYKDMGTIGVKNLPGWNTKVKGLLGQRKPDALIELRGKEPGFNPIWTEDDLWPRVLFICDEFQVIFQKASPENVDSIKEDIQQIAKVARAAGMHIFFTSQSMKGTVSSDILANFTLRIGLRCEPEVSMEVLRSTRASDIKEKNGFLIVQSQEMKTPEEQKRYRTPFLNDSPGSGKVTSSELYDNIKMLNDMAIAEGFKLRDVITYDEATKHYIAELDEFYHKLREANKLPESGLFVLGNRMAYSTNKAPDNIVITPRNNNNIMFCGNDYTDFVMFFNQMVFNIKQNKNPGTIIINSQVADLSYITCAEETVTYPDRHGYLVSEKCSCADMVTWMSNLVEARKSKSGSLNPVWIFLLGWDKGRGYAIEPDFDTRSRFNALLQTCGEFGIHIIMMNTSMTGVNSGTVIACNYCMAAKCSVDDSMALIGTKQAGLNYEIKNGWIFSKHDGVVTRDKLYITEMKREIASTEIVL